MLTKVLPCAPLFLVGVLTTSVQSQQPVQPLSVAVDHPIILAAGEGAASLTITNRSSAAVSLALLSGPVTDFTSGAVLSKAQITFAPLTSPAAAAPPSTNGKPVFAPAADPPNSIDASETLVLQVRATGVSAASATFDLFNKSTRLGQLTMAATDAPFNISLDGENSTEKPLEYTLGKQIAIPLKNSDPEPYHLHWDLRIDGSSQCAGELNTPASSGARITLTPVAPAHPVPLSPTPPSLATPAPPAAVRPSTMGSP